MGMGDWLTRLINWSHGEVISRSLVLVILYYEHEILGEGSNTMGREIGNWRLMFYALFRRGTS
jgi:hypothetical protein